MEKEMPLLIDKWHHLHFTSSRMCTHEYTKYELIASIITSQTSLHWEEANIDSLSLSIDYDVRQIDCFFFSSVSLYMNLITFAPRGRLEFQLVSHNYNSWCSRTTRNNNSFCRQLLIDLLVAYISILMPFLKPTLQWLSRVYLMNEY